MYIIQPSAVIETSPTPNTALSARAITNYLHAKLQAGTLAEARNALSKVQLSVEYSNVKICMYAHFVTHPKSNGCGFCLFEISTFRI